MSILFFIIGGALSISSLIAYDEYLENKILETKLKESEKKNENLRSKLNHK